MNWAALITVALHVVSAFVWQPLHFSYSSLQKVQHIAERACPASTVSSIHMLIVAELGCMCVCDGRMHYLSRVFYGRRAQDQIHVAGLSCYLFKIHFYTHAPAGRPRVHVLPFTPHDIYKFEQLFQFVRFGAIYLFIGAQADGGDQSHYCGRKCKCTFIRIWIYQFGAAANATTAVSSNFSLMFYSV